VSLAWTEASPHAPSPSLNHIPLCSASGVCEDWVCVQVTPGLARPCLWRLYKKEGQTATCSAGDELEMVGFERGLRECCRAVAPAPFPGWVGICCCHFLPCSPPAKGEVDVRRSDRVAGGHVAAAAAAANGHRGREWEWERQRQWECHCHCRC
jgi:hypothetical protein